MRMTPIRTTSIAIVGGGYAGLLAANRSAARGHQVTLINDRDRFVDRIRLHEIVAGTRPLELVTPRLADLLDRRIELLLGRAQRVESGCVQLADGRRVQAEHVVIATGSGAAHGPGSLEWATRAHAGLTQLSDGAQVVVLGGGPTGIEVATEVAEARPDLRIVLADPVTPGAALSPRGRRHLAAAFERHGIRVLASAPAADLVIDCTGFRLDTLATDSGLAGPHGPMDVDAHLRVPGLPNVWGAGDAVRVAGQPHLRMGCASAEPLGALVADAIHRVSRGAPAPAVSVGYVGLDLSLGRRDGLLQLAHADDSPRNAIVSGRAGALVKTAICWGAATAPVRWSRWYPVLPGPANRSASAMEPAAAHG